MSAKNQARSHTLSRIAEGKLSISDGASLLPGPFGRSMTGLATELRASPASRDGHGRAVKGP